jgi:hypothetical protein
MSHSAVTPIFSLKNVKASDIGSIHVIDVSDSLYFGRRFQLMYVDRLTADHTVSKVVKFSKIVQMINNISINENNLENLQEIKSFLGTLKSIELDSIVAFPHKGFLYRVLTWASRIFSSGSHLDRIQTIDAEIQAKIEILDPDSVNYKARMILIGRMDFANAESAILQLIEDCLKAKQLDDAFSACDCILEYKKSDGLYIRIAQAFIRKGELVKAASVMKKISFKKEEKIEMAQELVKACLSQDVPNKAVALQAISIIPYNDENRLLIEALRMHVDNA